MAVTRTYNRRKPIHVNPEDLAKAKAAALRLDIDLTDARYYMHPRSKDANRLADMIDKARDLRNLIEDFENEVAER